MKREDARKRPREWQEEKRKHVVRRRQRGQTYDEIAAQVELTGTAVFNIWQRYRTSGAAGIKRKQRGRRIGAQRRWTLGQEAQLRKLVCDQTPDQLQMPFALWSRSAVRALMAPRFKLGLAVRTVGEYLKRWGFSPHKPLKQAYEQRPAEVKRWLAKDYPAIAARAKQEDAEVHWGDEPGRCADDVRGRADAPTGHTPSVRVSPKREQLSLLASVTNPGKVRWRAFDGARDAKLLIDFFKRLIKDTGRKGHHAKQVKAWLAAHPDRIEVFLLAPVQPRVEPS